MLQRGVESFQGSKDPITAVTAAPHMLLIGRSSGDFVVYTLPDLVPVGNAAASNINSLLPCLLPIQLSFAFALCLLLRELSSVCASCPYSWWGIGWSQCSALQGDFVVLCPAVAKHWSLGELPWERNICCVT